jgi:hypothetical protein
MNLPAANRGELDPKRDFNGGYPHKRLNKLFSVGQPTGGKKDMFEG